MKTHVQHFQTRITNSSKRANTPWECVTTVLQDHRHGLPRNGVDIRWIYGFKIYIQCQLFRNQRWKKGGPFEASITPKHVCIQIILRSYVFLIYRKGRTCKYHLVFLVPSLTNYLTSLSYLYLAIMVQTPIITERMRLIYVLIFGRTEFMHLLNWLSRKLLFSLEILKFYHQMSFMTLAIVVINSCCLCCCLSDFIFV